MSLLVNLNGLVSIFADKINLRKCYRNLKWGSTEVTKINKLWIQTHSSKYQVKATNKLSETTVHVTLKDHEYNFQLSLSCQLITLSKSGIIKEEFNRKFLTLAKQNWLEKNQWSNPLVQNQIREAKL